MDLKHKLKELRISHNLTQEAVALKLGVSSQTVSKWERGILSPDIALLPRIALLYKCSIDSLFDMGMILGVEHRREFDEKIKELISKQDWDGVYRARIDEIQLNPDQYSDYSAIMYLVLRNFPDDKKKTETMIMLACHAEKYCADDDIRNEIYRVMIELCSRSEDPQIKEKAMYYYRKLPMLRHSREVFSVYVMKGEEHKTQVKKNLIYLIDMAECSIRQLISPEMSDEEQLFYYQKAASLYETILDEKYAGFYDPALLWDYYKIAILNMRLGNTDIAAAYVRRILKTIEKHLDKNEKDRISVLVHSSSLEKKMHTERSCKKIFRSMMVVSELEPFRDEIAVHQKRYEDFCDKNKE